MFEKKLALAPGQLSMLNKPVVDFPYIAAKATQRRRRSKVVSKFWIFRPSLSKI